MDAYDEFRRLKSIKRKLVIRFGDSLPTAMVVSELSARHFRDIAAKSAQLIIEYDEPATDEDIRKAENDAEESRKWAAIEAFADLDERESRALQKLKEDDNL